MTEVRMMFTGITNVIDQQDSVRIVMPDLREQHGTHKHTPIMVVKGKHKVENLKRLGQDKTKDFTVYLMDGLKAKSSLERSFGRSREYRKHLLPVRKGCPGPFPNCGDFSDTGKEDYIALNLTLASGNFQACYIDRIYDWHFKPSKPIGEIAGEICVEDQVSGEFTLEFETISKSAKWKKDDHAFSGRREGGKLIIDPDDDHEVVEIRFMNMPNQPRMSKLDKTVIDHHAMLYFDWSNPPLMMSARRPLKGMKKTDGQNQSHDHHLLDCTREIRHVLKLSGLDKTIRVPNHTNCPPGGWGGG